MGSVFLIIDCGSGGVKTFLLDPEGSILGRTERNWSRENWASDFAWKMIVDAVLDLLQDVDPFQIKAVCSTSMRQKFVLVDKKGKEIEYTLSPESKEFGKNLIEAFGERMYDVSGHWPIPNRIAGAVIPWLRETDPFRLDHTEHLLMVSDWVNMKLTGERCTEGTSACETALYNIKANAWDMGIINDLELPNNIFPAVKYNGENLAEVKTDIANLFGLHKGTPVIIGGADTQCGLLGNGAKRFDYASIGGTTTPVQMITDFPIFDRERRTWTNNFFQAGSWIIESNAGSTGKALRWLKEKISKIDYDELNKLAKITPKGSNGVQCFLGCHLFDAGPPYWEKDRLGDMDMLPMIVGNNSFDLGDLARSIIESNCYAVKANVEQLKEITGRTPDELIFCGGNSKSKIWAQIQADVLGIPLKIPRIRDSTAVGAAILAAVGTGFYDNLETAVSNMVDYTPIVIPEKDATEIYFDLYKKWMDTRRSMGRKQ